ncbi:MAG: ArsA family ATPase [Deltaproteobacteria bacterium]|nr:ArsA family ATPase [Deltaproteobacteria bacterium]
MEGASSTGPRYLFFSGKGGVGKTTLAAATAVYLHRLGWRVLIVSTDPAHSLSDVFATQIGHEGVQLAPGLGALEVDSSRRWAEATGAAAEGIKTAKGRRGRMQKALFEAMEVMGRAPGVDEFMSLELLIETMESDAFDAVVFDTAPTGHTLRLLDLPQMLDGWIGRMMNLRSQFARIGRVVRRLWSSGQTEEEGLGEQLEDTKARMQRVHDLLADPERCLMTLVSIPEALGVAETTRTLETLQQRGLAVSQVVANQLQPESPGCAFCRRRRAMHMAEAERLQKAIGELPLRVLEAQDSDIRGLEALSVMGKRLWPTAPWDGGATGS